MSSKQQVKAALASSPPAPGGDAVLVPREPTDEMIFAGMDANQRCDYGAVAERARSREEARVEVLGRDEVTTSERPMKFKDFLGGALYGWCGEYRRGWNDALDAEREWSSQTSPPTPHGEAVLKAAHAIRLAQGAALAIGASEEMQAAFLQRCADVISKYGDTLLTLIEGCEVRSPYALPAEVRESVGDADVEFWADRLDMLGDMHNCGGGTMKVCARKMREMATALAQPRDTPRDSAEDKGAWDLYLGGGCTDSECALCFLPPWDQKRDMHHAGISVYPRPGTQPDAAAVDRPTRNDKVAWVSESAALERAAAVGKQEAEDAARYRFLRDPANSIVYALDWVSWSEAPHSGRSHFRYDKPEQLDAAIDAQLTAMQSPTGEPT